jgi:hypothetical protein
MAEYRLSSSGLKPGQWVKCEQTLEVGQIESFNGNTVCVSLGDGITLYTTPEGLKHLGWQLIPDKVKNGS